ncbi:hypothetical protein [Brevibacterium antiquum]|uniref:Uncharacterized protein n=1 Tax=Brevibacterium antiquum TaxID=234835 RepID=A0A2H1INA4_9MICO|nr:hypothetical protein [Brevibacterium antiquum]SMX76636.1 hypothetical protein BANT10_01115 [Brevibacterium antiquum]
MSDLNEWIKERRRIHDAATEGPWEADGFVDEYQGEDVIRLSIWSGPPSSEDSPVVVHSIRSHENTEFILDAHNTLPALLTAVENVLELHQRVPNSTSALYPNPLCTCGQNHPCPTVRTIEGAIK